MTEHLSCFLAFLNEIEQKPMHMDEHGKVKEVFDSAAAALKLNAASVYEARIFEALEMSEFVRIEHIQEHRKEFLKSVTRLFCLHSA